MKIYKNFFCRFEPTDICTRGVVLKQLNYPISMLQILFRFVNRKVNDNKNDLGRSCKFTHFYKKNILINVLYDSKIIKPPLLVGVRNNKTNAP